MGMRINKQSNCIYYLIDEGGRPDWFPYMLFEISDNKLAKDWSIKIFNKEEPGDIYYLCGFWELVNDDNFHDLLIERDQQTMDIYFKQKQL